MLRVLFIASLIFGLCYGETCRTTTDLIRGVGPITVSGTVKCNGEPLYGAYIQLVDNFQAVNDVVGHGHTHHDGTFKVHAKYYFYSDKDLAPAKGSWKIVVYSYCGVDNFKKNQCHRVTKKIVQDSDGHGDVKCLSILNKDDQIAQDVFLTTAIDIALQPGDDDKQICLDSV